MPATKAFITFLLWAYSELADEAEASSDFKRSDFGEDEACLPVAAA